MKVEKCPVLGWHVVDDASGLRMQPNGHGTRLSFSYRSGVSPPVTYQQAIVALNRARAPFVLKRFGTRFSTQREELCVALLEALSTP